MRSMNSARSLIVGLSISTSLIVVLSTAVRAQVAADGTRPFSTVIKASDGNLYGVTNSGGSYNCGTIYRIATNGTGYSILHSFAGGASEGANPFCELVQGADGNLYGGTMAGGSSNYGTLFEIALPSDTFTNLHSFTGTDGAEVTGLTCDTSNPPVLYGVTFNGGASGDGCIFSSSSTGTINWHQDFSGSDGNGPDAAPILDGSTLYGTTSSGGANGYGSLYKITTSNTGFSDFHDFTLGEGNSSRSRLFLDGTTLYGTARIGGSNNVGTVFAIDETGGTVTNEGTFTSSGAWLPIEGVVESSNFASDHNLWGVASNYSSSGPGVLYTLDTSNNTFA